MPSSPAPPARPSAKRDHLVATAERLFYRDGYRAVGIDTVLAEAEVAKMTLYRHFASKDELIVAVLEKRSGEVLHGLRAAAAETKGPPAKRLLAVFDWLAAWYATDEFRGCAFIRALSEFPEVNHPVHQAAWRHKQAMKEILAELARPAGAKDPHAVGEALRLVIDGSLVAAHAGGSPAAAAQAKRTAALIIKAA